VTRSRCPTLALVSLTAALALPGTGCGGGATGQEASGGPAACALVSVADAAPFEGIYQLTSYTENNQTCDAEGPSLLATEKEKLAVVKAVTAFGINVVWLQSCADVANCTDKAAKLGNTFGAASNILFQFSCVQSSNELSATMANTGFTGSQGVCTKPSISNDTLTRDPAAAIRVESREQIGDDYPVDPDGFCTTALGRVHSADKPCTHYRVLTGTFLQKI
jgi:hypothetical protein